MGPWSRRAGPLAMPGTYTAELLRRDESGTTHLGEPQSFTPKVLAAAGVPPADVEARHAFQREVAALQRQVFGAVSALNASIERVEALAEAIDESGAEGDLRAQASAIREGLLDLRVRFLGDDTVRSRREAVLPGHPRPHPAGGGRLLVHLRSDDDPPPPGGNRSRAVRPSQTRNS